MSLLVSKKAESANVTQLTVKSNAGGNVSLLTGNALVRVEYRESMLQDTIKTTVVFADTGDSVNGQSVVEGLPLVGTEEVNLTIQDNNNQSIKVTLYVNEVTPLIVDVNKSMTSINLVSEEFLLNETGEVRLSGRFDGKISDHIKTILKKILKTKKKVDTNVEDTSNNYNFIGNNRKPYYTINWLSRYSIPTKAGKEGKTAGFFFFETSEGFHFKSIDSLFAQKQKKSLTYTGTSDRNENVPEGYAGKILSHAPNNIINAQEKFQMGAYSTRLVIFDPFTCFYKVIKEEASDSGVSLGGKNLPKLNNKFKSQFTRTTYMLLDKGTLPTGTTQQQISKSKDLNLETQKVLNQAIRRYNQLFASMETITIAADFSLHAGDKIFIDVPGLRPDRDDSVDDHIGGSYIIAELCHYISSTKTYTKLSLIRDSFGRKGNHTTRN